MQTLHSPPFGAQASAGEITVDHIVISSIIIDTRPNFGGGFCFHPTISSISSN
jgi:hypothetical protein